LLTELRERALAGSKRTGLPEFVFESETSRSQHLTVVHRTWRNVIKAADLAGLRPHDLRHSFASFAVSAGESLPTIGKLLGHRSHASTHRYSHLHLDPQRLAVDKIGAIVAAASKPRAAPELPPWLSPGVISPR
jgi:integrase